MLVPNGPTPAVVGYLLEHSNQVLRDIHMHLDEIVAVASHLTPVEDLVVFQTQVEDLHEKLELLTASSELIIQISQPGLLLITADSALTQRQLLGIGSAGLRETSYFATAVGFATLQATVNSISAQVVAVQASLANYATTAALTAGLASVTGSSATSIAALVVQLNAIDARLTAQENLVDGIESQLSILDGLATANGSAITTLSLLITATQNTLQITNSSLTALTATVTTNGETLTAQGAIVSQLLTRVTQTETGMDVNSSDITVLTSRVTDAEADITGYSQAVGLLSTQVTLLDGEIDAQAAASTALAVTVGNNAAAATTALNAGINTLTGLMNAQYTLVLDVNGYISGFRSVNTGNTATFTILADNFRIVTPGEGAVTPFSVENGHVNVLNDLQMTAGRIVKRAGGFMKVEGIGFGTTNQFLEWFGPIMAINLCDELNGITYVRIDGTVYTGGATTTPPPANSAVILLTNGNWQTGDGISPTSCTFAMGNTGVLTVMEDGSYTAATPTDNWMRPISPVNAALYECKVDPTVGTFSAGSDPTGVWLALGEMRSWLVSKSGPLGGISKDCTFTIQVRAIATPGTILSTATMLISAYYDNVGTPPPECVVIGSFLPDGRYAGQVDAGDRMLLANADTLIESEGIVQGSRASQQECVQIKTSSGVSLSCSLSAPIPLLGGGYSPASKLKKGDLIPVKTDDNPHWEAVASVEPIGIMWVQRISVHDECFWAGDEFGRYILHHNIRFKE